jgi:hypothetical protein
MNFFVSRVAGAPGVLRAPETQEGDIINSEFTYYPPNHCVLAPTANKLANSAGENALTPVINDNAKAFNVPSTAGLGETSFSASWIAVNDMLTPLLKQYSAGAMTQKVVSYPLDRRILNPGKATKKTGYALAHQRMTPLVPMRCCRGGKTKRIQMA